MQLRSLLKPRFVAARKRGSLWVKLLDVARLLGTSQGRSILWTRAIHGDQVHQTTTFTCEERYPALFDLVADLAPDAERILSFGCSTGEELVALRRRFPRAEIIGAEINPRSRRIAVRRCSSDPRTKVVKPKCAEGPFDLIFAMAVLQREPAKIVEMGVEDLSAHYPFEQFDSAVRDFGAALRSGGLLCVSHAQYRIEDSSIAGQLEPVPGAPAMEPPLFGPDGRRLKNASSRSIHRKRR